MITTDFNIFMRNAYLSDFYLIADAQTKRTDSFSRLFIGIYLFDDKFVSDFLFFDIHFQLLKRIVCKYSEVGCIIAVYLVVDIAVDHINA